MGLFGTKKNPEDLRYEAMAMMEKNQPKAAISLFNKILKQNDSDSDALLNKGLALNQIKKLRICEKIPISIEIQEL